ncbi:Uncharacterised protein [Klebsiella pneumoniae]|nr:Uncharacterised protein [Klebsiella pneumoniae]
MRRNAILRYRSLLTRAQVFNHHFAVGHFGLTQHQCNTCAPLIGTSKLFFKVAAAVVGHQLYVRQRIAHAFGKLHRRRLRIRT